MCPPPRNIERRVDPPPVRQSEPGSATRTFGPGPGGGSRRRLGLPTVAIRRRLGALNIAAGDRIEEFEMLRDNWLVRPVRGVRDLAGNVDQAKQSVTEHLRHDRGERNPVDASVHGFVGLVELVGGNPEAVDGGSQRVDHFANLPPVVRTATLARQGGCQTVEFAPHTEDVVNSPRCQLDDFESAVARANQEPIALKATERVPNRGPTDVQLLRQGRFDGPGAGSHRTGGNGMAKQPVDVVIGVDGHDLWQ